MTTDTTFKEFVEEKGIRFARLIYDSDEYRELARQFNKAKLQIIDENRPVRETGGREEATDEAEEG